ncbi:MAG: terminase family protein [bacterium]
MATKEIPLGYEPRAAFVEFHRRRQRWAVIIAHRRAGKTVACLMDMLDHALRKPGGRYAYIAPFYNQAKSVAWDYLKAFSRPVLTSAPNESELRVDLINGSRISLYGGDNSDRLRGLALDGVILDEFADMSPSLWAQVVRPALADRRGWAVIIGTVKGRNQLWQQYEAAKGDPEGWFSSVLRAGETGILPPDELADARRIMTAEQYAAEFDCDPSAAIVGAYFGRELAEAERAGRITAVAPAPGVKVNTAWDLGIGDSTAIWLFQAYGGEIRVLAHYENHGQPLSHYVAELDAIGTRLGIEYGNDYVPHDARVRSLETGRTRVETLAALGRRPMLVPAHKLMDGINAVRLTLPRMWFDAEECKQGLEALRQYRAEFDEKTRAYKDTPRHDWTSHSADAARYMCMAWREIAQAPIAGDKPPDFRGFGQMTYDEVMKMSPSNRRDFERA